MPDHLALAAQAAEAKDLWALAQHIHDAAREIAEFDAFHLLVVHHGEPLPMHYVLFADTKKTWPGARYPAHDEAARTTHPLGIGDVLALERRATVDERSMPLPYGDAFNPSPSQLYVPILHRLEPLGVLSPLSGTPDFFTPDHRRQFEGLAAKIAPLIAQCLRAD